MKLKGKIILEGKNPSIIKLKYPLNVYRKPELYISRPTWAIKIAPYLCKDMVVKYQFPETFIMMDSRKNALDCTKIKLHEYSTKYVNQIVLGVGVGVKIELDYELIVSDDEHTEFKRQGVVDYWDTP